MDGIPHSGGYPGQAGPRRIRKEKKDRITRCGLFWSEYRDLNPRPLGPEPSALPAALYPEEGKLLSRADCLIIIGIVSPFVKSWPGKNF